MHTRLLVAIATTLAITSPALAADLVVQSEKDKKIVGDTWAAASGGTCLFVMPVARDSAAIDREIARV